MRTNSVSGVSHCIRVKATGFLARQPFYTTRMYQKRNLKRKMEHHVIIQHCCTALSQYCLRLLFLCRNYAYVRGIPAVTRYVDPDSESRQIVGRVGSGFAVSLCSARSKDDFPPSSPPTCVLHCCAI
jgi:hypothetical protein